jgi:predicted PolB exonuclease-like 3'-5' exonuclease
MDVLGGWGEKRGVSLHEIATVSGIPGKFDTAGEEVAELWLNGKLAEIVHYNCYDALTTYLVWLRLAHFAGHFDNAQYEDEQQRVRDLLMDLSEKPETAFLEAYFDEWERLQQATGQV